VVTLEFASENPVAVFFKEVLGGIYMLGGADSPSAEMIGPGF